MVKESRSPTILLRKVVDELSGWIGALHVTNAQARSAAPRQRATPAKSAA